MATVTVLGTEVNQRGEPPRPAVLQAAALATSPNANPAAGDLKSGTETIPRSSLSPGNPARFRQKAPFLSAPAGAPQKMAENPGFGSGFAGAVFARVR